MREVARDVFQIPLTPFSGINAYYADGVLFDAGTRLSRGRVLRALRGKDMTAHALTHAHPDHQGATHAVCEAHEVPLFVGAADAPAMDGSEPTPIPGNPVTATLDALWSGPPHPVAFQLAEGDRVGRFFVIDTPGHTPGHVAFWDEYNGVLILGDVLRNLAYLTLQTGLREPPDLLTLDPARNRRSARKLIGLRPKVVLFGHGPPFLDADRFDAFVRALPE